MSRPLRVGSLFSGAGGFDIGFCAAGFEPAWFCEIDPTARAVLERHWPSVPCYEDINTLDPAALTAVDVLIGGFPCQDVSVAGKRAGLAGNRSGLFWQMARIIEGLRPTWLVLENVPGLLSSDGPNDMGTVLWALGERGYGWAYRVLDAQHWGVPQRRRRVFIVGHSGADTRRAAQVLFESDRGEGDSAESSPERQELAYCLSASARGTGDGHGNAWNSTYIADTVRSHPRPGSNSVGAICFEDKGTNVGWSDDLAPTLRVGADSKGLFQPAVAATLRSRNHAPGVNEPGRGGEDDQNLIVIDEQNAATVPMVGSLSTGGAHTNRGFAIANTIQASAGHHGHGIPRGDGGDNLVATLAHCLNGSQERLDGSVETFVTSLAENQRGELRTSDVSPALGAGGGKPGSRESAAWNGATVRRLMPVETEALQGWPRDWTRWTADGKDLADGPRYRLVGNGVAAPVARWIAERIAAVEAAS